MEIKSNTDMRNLLSNYVLSEQRSDKQELISSFLGKTRQILLVTDPNTSNINDFFTTMANFIENEAGKHSALKEFFQSAGWDLFEILFDFLSNKRNNAIDEPQNNLIFNSIIEHCSASDLFYMSVQTLESDAPMEIFGRVVDALGAGLNKMEMSTSKRLKSCIKDSMPVLWRRIRCFCQNSEEEKDLRVDLTQVNVLLSRIFFSFSAICLKNYLSKALLTGIVLSFFEDLEDSPHGQENPDESFSELNLLYLNFAKHFFSTTQNHGIGVDLHIFFDTHCRYALKEWDSLHSKKTRQPENETGNDFLKYYSIYGQIPWSSKGIALVAYALIMKPQKESNQTIAFPQVLSWNRYFEVVFPNISPLLQSRSIFGCSRGLYLLEWLLGGMRASKNKTLLYWDPNLICDLTGKEETCIQSSLKKLKFPNTVHYRSLLEQLVNFLASCPNQDLRLRARNVLESWLDLFDDQSRFFLLSHAVGNCPYPSLKSIFLDRVKKDVANAMKQSQIDETSICSPFLQQRVIKIFVLPWIESLLKASVDDTLSNLDCFLSALALYRFLLLIDREKNQTQIWNAKKCIQMKTDFEVLLGTISKNMELWEAQYSAGGGKDQEISASDPVKETRLEISIPGDYFRIAILQESISYILDLLKTSI